GAVRCPKCKTVFQPPSAPPAAEIVDGVRTAPPQPTAPKPPTAQFAPPRPAPASKPAAPPPKPTSPPARPSPPAGEFEDFEIVDAPPLPPTKVTVRVVVDQDNTDRNGGRR